VFTPGDLPLMAVRHIVTLNATDRTTGFGVPVNVTVRTLTVPILRG
jgi:hypothetical protein